MSYRLTILLTVLMIGLAGCSTLIEKGTVVESKCGGYYEYVPKEYIKIEGMGKGEFPDGTKGEGKPMIDFPDLEYKAD